MASGVSGSGELSITAIVFIGVWMSLLFVDGAWQSHLKDWASVTHFHCGVPQTVYFGGYFCLQFVISGTGYRFSS